MKDRIQPIRVKEFLFSKVSIAMMKMMERQEAAASENFYATTDWDPAPSPAKGTAAPKATLRVLGRESVNVNMAMAELLNAHGCVVEHSE